MKRRFHIGILVAVLVIMSACHTPTREAKRMVARAEALADTLPDSTIRLIDSVLHIPVYFSERQRMDMALLQAEAIFRDMPLDDDEFEDTAYHVATSPELERAAEYFAKKKQYAKAAHAALYSGYVQQHYNEKENAMRSYMAAEQYGLLSNDSLTAARAEYKMGKLLYEDFMEEDALVLLEKSDSMFGKHHVERAYVQNAKAVGFIMLKQFDNSEQCLQASLSYAEQDHSNKAKLKALNNYSVLYRMQGKFGQAIDCLKQIEEFPSLDDAERLLLYLNLGNAYAAFGEIDSANAYYLRLEEILTIAHVRDETKVSAYGALYRFAESQGNTDSALRYIKTREKLLSGLLANIEIKSVYRIQQQYDYGNLQNEMNRKLILRQRIIDIVGILAITGLIALTFSLIRLAKIRKQEAEAKSSLFHFMQQHKELEQQHDIYALQLSDALNKNALTMRKLDIYLENKGDPAYLAALKKAVFGNEDHWEALMNVFDTLYPNVRNSLIQQHPELTEIEQKDFILSYFNVSREEEALLFKKSVHTVDKIRNSVRRKMKETIAEQSQ